MSSAVEYFANNRPKPKYHIGDRVEGYFKKAPWVGTVGCDNMLNETEGSLVGVHLDLPLEINGVVYQYIRVKYKDLKRRT